MGLNVGLCVRFIITSSVLYFRHTFNIFWMKLTQVELSYILKFVPCVKNCYLFVDGCPITYKTTFHSNKVSLTVPPMTLLSLSALLLPINPSNLYP